jgi:pimeloyl-ACP methyl ester carboxylesterase
MKPLHAALSGALLLAALPGHGDPLLEPGSHPVGKVNVTLIDSSRPTPTDSYETTSNQRVLDTSVWYPAQPRDQEWLRPGPPPLARQVCPTPLVIYSHGFMSMRHNGAYLADYLASKGYIVAAADFPLTHLGTPGGPRFVDVLNQPGDVSFIIDSLLNNNTDGLPDLADCIDPQRIAVVGLSLGGMTTTLLAFHPELRDSRVAAAVSIASPVALLGERFFLRDTPPFMIIAGDIDAMINYRDNIEVLAKGSHNITIVTLSGGSHTGFAGLSAWLFNWLDNPDSIGCWALRGEINGDIDMPDGFMARLRGDADAAGPDMTLLPCREPELPHAMRPKHQLMLTRYSIYAFLQSTLHPDKGTRERYARLLEDTLPNSFPELRVEPRP